MQEPVEHKETGLAKLEIRHRRATSDKIVAGIAISHPNREIFPKTKLTKAGLAEYYAALGQRFMAHVGGRPLSLLRCTSGMTGECFFQKHASKGFPEEIDSIEVKEASGQTASYITVRSIAAAVAAVQMGTIEFHIWGSRNDDLEKPDRLVFDLDPDEDVSFARVIDAAHEVRDVLAELGLNSAPMITGGKGIHVICRLRRSADWNTHSLFARSVAQHLAERKPDDYVATMSKAKRHGKIFIDWMRNQRGSTAIAPYSVRARDGGPVAMPVRWDELSGIKSANEFGVGDAIGRLSTPCPLLEMPHDQPIGKTAVARLERFVA